MSHINHSPVLVAHAARRLPYVSDSMKPSPRSVAPTLTTCIVDQLYLLYHVAVIAVPFSSDRCAVLTAIDALHGDVTQRHNPSIAHG